MMNVKNFHLKSAFLNFNSQILNNELHKQFNKSSKEKINRSLTKTSQRVQMLMKNFRLASKNTTNKEKSVKNQSNNTHFDFQPPQIQSHRSKTVYNLSCTLSPNKALQKMSSFQMYKSGFKENLHRRRFSDTSFLKSRKQKYQGNKTNEKYKQKQKPVNPQSSKTMIQNLICHEQFNKFQINQHSSRIYGFSKSTNKIKVFEIDNYFNHLQDQSNFDKAKNSSFITTLPTKRKNFRTAKSSCIKERKSKQTISLQKSKMQMILIEAKMNEKSQSKEDNFKRPIHTAGSMTTRRIDLDKGNFTPISSGFLPQSPLWNKEQQRTKRMQNKPRTFRLKDKQFMSKTQLKQKDNPCRPWSPGKPQNNTVPFQDQIQFPCVQQN